MQMRWRALIKTSSAPVFDDCGSLLSCFLPMNFVRVFLPCVRAAHFARALAHSSYSSLPSVSSFARLLSARLLSARCCFGWKSGVWLCPSGPTKIVSFYSLFIGSRPFSSSSIRWWCVLWEGGAMGWLRWLRGAWLPPFLRSALLPQPFSSFPLSQLLYWLFLFIIGWLWTVQFPSGIDSF